MSVKAMLAAIPAEHLKTAIVAGLTEMGSLVLVEHKDMNLSTLKKLSKQIRDRIKQMEDEE